tara:strand:- start:977 stop:1690 length:714 start_codon:yes stop_codon:yes gene_type:complete
MTNTPLPRSLTAAVLVILMVGLSLSCEEPEVCVDEDYLDGKRDACVEAKGMWHDEHNACIPATRWLMVQHASSLEFQFDAELDAECPEDALWSGTALLGGASETTLWFSERPYRYAFAQPTDQFIWGFREGFTADADGPPSAVLEWNDEDTGHRSSAVVELRYVNDTLPGLDESSGALRYPVCGLPLDDPSTRAPLPSEEQQQPPASPSSTGRVSMLIHWVPASAHHDMSDVFESAN